MADWYITPKLKGAPSGRAISADNFIPEDKNSVSIFIREVFQNILDARKFDLTNGKKETAIVKFQILTEGNEISPGVHDKYFKELEPFISSTELSQKFNTVKSKPSALVFEEENTVGLTGCTTDSDYGMFNVENGAAGTSAGDLIDVESQRWNLFWHSEAKESKGLALLGRAGQGKITYNLNSACGSVFALTNQEGGQSNLLFGKCRFPSTFENEGNSYLGHAFFCKKDTDSKDSSNIQPLPILDNASINEFRADFKLTRKRHDLSGTSWVIPYIDKNVLNKDDLIRATIAEFYLAILEGELIVYVEGEKIDQMTLRDLVETYGIAEKQADRDYLLWLIDAILRKDQTYTLNEGWFVDSNSPASETCLDTLELDDARKRYHLGETIHFSVPIPVTKVSSGQKETTFGDVYLKKNESGVTKEIFARDCLIIEHERHLKRAPGKNFGAFIAKDAKLNAFLGDADHASHLTWNNKNPRLIKNYMGYQTSLSMVRSSLPAIAKLVASLDQQVYENLFDDLMSIAIKKGAFKSKKKKKQTGRGGGGPKVKRQPEFNLETTDKNTIQISNGDAFSLTNKTRKIQIALAYENFATNGDPFKLYHRFDFDLADFKDKDFNLKNCSIVSREDNLIELEIRDQDFAISINGFDAHECRVAVIDV